MTKLIRLIGLSIYLFFISFRSPGQDLPKRSRIDNNLSLVFPDSSRRTDTLGVSIFQTTKEKITYQVIKRGSILDADNKSDREGAVKGAAEVYLKTVRFEHFQKRITDTLIGGVHGKYIRMDGIERGLAMKIFIFVTSINRDMYLIQATSFNTEAFTTQMIRWFLSHMEFRGKSY